MKTINTFIKELRAFREEFGNVPVVLEDGTDPAIEPGKRAKTERVAVVI